MEKKKQRESESVECSFQTPKESKLGVTSVPRTAPRHFLAFYCPIHREYFPGWDFYFLGKIRCLGNGSGLKREDLVLVWCLGEQRRWWGEDTWIVSCKIVIYQPKKCSIMCCGYLGYLPKIYNIYIYTHTLQIISIFLNWMARWEKTNTKVSSWKVPSNIILNYGQIILCNTLITLFMIEFFL